METMFYRPTLDQGRAAQPVPALVSEFADCRTWRDGLPVLHGPGLTLRELTVADAPSLHAQLTTEEVSRFVSPPPATVEGFERFILWSHRQRAAGRTVCFAVVPAGQTAAVGMFQVQMRDPAQHLAEWGFVLGSAHWGTGLFVAGALAVLEFVFTTLGVRRLEARSALPNGRGNGALRKIGAVCEAILPQSFERQGERLDQALWTIRREHGWAATLGRGHTRH